MTTLRLDPARPVLWRDAETVQLGIGANAVRLDVDGPWLPRMLDRLGSGIPERAFEVVAHGLGASLPAARRLRTAIAPLLVVDTPRPTTRIEPSPALDARTLLRLDEALDEAGVDLVEGDDTGAADVPVVLLRHGAVAARDALPQLVRDRPHVALSFDAGGASVGPLVLPGRTPCLSCRDAHDRERDPAWAALHVQLLERDPGHIPLAVIVAAAAACAGLLSEHAESTRSGESRTIRVSRDGRRASRTVRFHADCACRSPRGSATGGVPHGPRPATTSSSAYARRA